MSKEFIHKDFLLQNKFAEDLYHRFAADEPIIDYHCHLPPEQIADDINFRNLTHIWLDGDHYKWRAMRTSGVDESLITGVASDKEKFMAWARTVPRTLKNPLYHWTHMELKNPFGISNRLLNEDSAEEIWEQCNEKLQLPEFSARGLLKKNNVKVVGTTDDPTDSMEHHIKVAAEDTEFKMVPTFRPDNGMEIDNPSNFTSWISKLERSSDIDITDFDSMIEALRSRHDLFHKLGGRASDHGLDRPYGYEFSDSQIDQVFDKAMTGKDISLAEINLFRSAFIYHCGLMNHEKGWVMQFHIGAIRNNNTRMKNKLGPNTGFDSIGDFETALPLSRMLDKLDAENKLPKTILYNINPGENELYSTMIGNFQDGSIPGKVQHGPSWWFLDQKDGIEAQMISLSNMGLLSEFIGMTTDSRSFLSYPRHDYFRRILCNMLGDDMEKGIVPDDLNLIGGLVKKICFANANRFFGFEV